MLSLRRRPLHGAWGPLEQPIGPVEVDWTHPLAAGLVGAYIPTMLEYRPATSINGAPPAMRDLSGAGASLLCDDAGNVPTIIPAPFSTSNNAPIGVEVLHNLNGYRAAANVAQRPTAAASFFCRSYLVNNGTLTSYPAIFGCTYGKTSTTPFDCYNVRRPSGATTSLSFSWNVNGTNGNLTVAGVLTGNFIYNIGFSLACNGVAGASAAYVNGVQTTTTATSGSITYSAGTSQIYFNGVDGASGNTGMAVSVAYIWNRALSAGEQALLNAEPYAPLRPVARRRWVVPGAVVVGGAQARALIMA